MTVTYTAQVATCRGFGCFLKLLFKWRGSIYKLVWLDLVCFLFIYYVLNLMYRTCLDQDQKHIFEAVVQYCKEYSDQIPLSFVLGFYVSIVMTRWWNQYTSIPWPDSMAVFVSANIHGQDERGRLMRRTIMRYVCLCLTMVLTNVSPRVKKRFPTYQHLVDAGLMVENEKNVMDQFNMRFNSYSKHWMPIVWAASIVTRARKEGRIRDDIAVKTIIDELNKFRGQVGVLIAYDTISVPLVYTQVVTLAVYTYFMTAIMAQQWTEAKATNATYVNIIDLYFPLFTTLQFFFYMGWLKVAESLINPFGEDDDDFEVNWMIDRNLQVSYMIVDEMHHNHPNLVRDQYWDEIPSELPYTLETQPFREKHPEPSTANIEIPKTSMTSVKLDEMVGKSVQSVNYKFPDNDVEANDDAISGIHFTTGRTFSNRKGSSNSLASMAGSMPRVNSVVNSFKRMFSRDETRGQTPFTPGGAGPTTPDVAQPPRIVTSSSSSSLIQAKYPSMKITDQVIEEVDEQMTITSMRGPDIRPTAASLFPPNNLPTSKPVDVPSPRNNSDYQRTQSFAHQKNTPFVFPIGDESHPIGFLSTSAPASNSVIETPTGNAYDLCIEDYEDDTPPVSQRTLVADAKSSASGDSHYEKRKLNDRPNRFLLARSVSAQQQPQTPPQNQPVQLQHGDEGSSGTGPNTLLLEGLPPRSADTPSTSTTGSTISANHRADNTPL